MAAAAAAGGRRRFRFRDRAAPPRGGGKRSAGRGPGQGGAASSAPSAGSAVAARGWERREGARQEAGQGGGCGPKVVQCTKRRAALAGWNEVLWRLGQPPLLCDSPSSTGRQPSYHPFRIRVGRDLVDHLVQRFSTCGSGPRWGSNDDLPGVA
ncbi:uncharacterized protein LOC131199354 isoform X2 [Ahaetulla prasina]|uniref:uncharacterized protein LOC131199354 isoform X2 n=1 Tax=Ahaetulla prasina TaxID=499056 RepID=UPI002648EF9A|nr:uncharacterized protein LOC131199354 isoform X2 [Ahaetulla prasina]